MKINIAWRQFHSPRTRVSSPDAVWSSFFVQMHVNLRGLFDTKSHLCRRTAVILLDQCLRRTKGVITFAKRFSAKLNLIAWLEFQLAYFKTVVQHFSHYTTMGTSRHQIQFIVIARAPLFAWPCFLLAFPTLD